MNPRTALGVIGRATVRRLTGPRGFGFTRMAIGARAVVTGHGPRRPDEPGAPPVGPLDELRLASAVAAGDHAAARSAATAILAAHPDHRRALEALRDADLADGALSAALERVEAIRAIDPHQHVSHADDALFGIFITSDVRWLPRIPGRVHPVIAAEGSSVLEVADATLLTRVERELPRPAALVAAAWRLAHRAETERPAAIHVTPGPGEIAALQVALAIQRHTGLPVRAEPYRDDPAIPATSELASRRRSVAEAVTAALDGTARPVERA